MGDGLVEWVKVDKVPAVFRHTWRDISDATVRAVHPGDIIPWDRDECLMIFYGVPQICPCGLTVVEPL